MVNTKEFNAMPHLVTAGVVTAMAIVIGAPKFVANLIAPICQVKRGEFFLRVLICFIWHVSETFFMNRIISSV